jgi:hypothetical protein
MNNYYAKKHHQEFSRVIFPYSVAILAILLGITRSIAGELVNPFSTEGNWYKAALHVHTKTSDGDTNAAARVKQYRDSGFKVVAITDHWKTNNIDGMSDNDFLVIRAMEAHPKSNSEMTNHFVCLNLPEGFEIKRSTKAQKIINMVNEAGGGVIYAHPYWLAHTINDLTSVTGYMGIEVYNGVCDVMIDKGYGNVHWDQLLNKGLIVPAVATDDIHKSKNIGLGWTMIKARELNTNEIINALKTGCYYASCGPIIEDFKVENGVASIKCSPATQICFGAQAAIGRKFCAEDGKLLTTAEWKMTKKCRFVRAEVVDANGKHAWTNPIIPK